MRSCAVGAPRFARSTASRSKLSARRCRYPSAVLVDIEFHPELAHEVDHAAVQVPAKELMLPAHLGEAARPYGTDFLNSIRVIEVADELQSGTPVAVLVGIGT